MSKRFNNTRLLILLAGLIAILVLTTITKIPREKATLKDKIVEFDSSEVDRIILYPRISDGDAVEFTRNNGKWEVKQGAVISATQKGAVQSLFGEVLNIKPLSLAAKNKSKWTEFELTDSLATRITFFNKNGKNLADLMIGKFSYRQAENPYGMYGRNNIQGISYVRTSGEEEVYGVDGFISLALNRKFEDWRDNSFIYSNQDDITNIRFTYPGNTAFNLVKKDSVWLVSNQIADSLNVATFLSTLSYLNGEEFKDNFKPVLNPGYVLLIEGNNLLNISIKCYTGENDDEYILNSSLNPDVYFTSKKDGIFDRLFKPESYFLTQNGKI